MFNSKLISVYLSALTSPVHIPVKTIKQNNSTSWSNPILVTTSRNANILRLNPNAAVTGPPFYIDFFRKPVNVRNLEVCRISSATLHSGINPMELMFKQKILFNNRIGNCSTVLKIKVSNDYNKKGIEPEIVEWRNKQYLKSENYRENAILYYGIGWEEVHRKHANIRNWQPIEVRMPLIDEVIDNDDVLASYDIRQPKLYDLGFTHNNCKGRCVKAGQTHFRNLKEKLPEVFEETMQQEFYMQQYDSSYQIIRRLEEHGFDDDVKETYLQDLEDCYKPYFEGKRRNRSLSLLRIHNLQLSVL